MLVVANRTCCILVLYLLTSVGAKVDGTVRIFLLEAEDLVPNCAMKYSISENGWNIEKLNGKVS